MYIHTYKQYTMGIVHVRTRLCHIYISAMKTDEITCNSVGMAVMMVLAVFLSVHSKLVLSCKQKTVFFLQKMNRQKIDASYGGEEKKHNYVSKIKGAAHK